jgi:hypothetical protein
LKANRPPTDPNDSDLSDWVNGTVNVELFSTPYSATTASEAATINSYAANPGTEETAASLLFADFTQQLWGRSSSTETSVQSLSVSGGSFDPISQGNYDVGNSISLPDNSQVYYALVAIYSPNPSIFGVLVLNGEAGYSAGIDTAPAIMSPEWPNQNLLLAPLPEPTMLAFVGSGGLSALLFRRRNVKP